MSTPTFCAGQYGNLSQQDPDFDYVIKDADHRHGSRGTCVKDTRRAILESIYLWASDFEELPVYWLNGLAGTGKTTIAQTIADGLSSEKRLGASFFCSSESKNRREFKNIFPTLAFQLSQKYKELGCVLPFETIAYDFPGVRQTPWLVEYLGSLTPVGISTVIVIDALDECKQNEVSAILSLIKKIASKNVKIFITSRPGQQIQEELDSWDKAIVKTVSLHEIKFREVNKDIRRFFQHHLSKLKGGRGGLDDWPATEDLDRLCKRANGEFVYAMAMVEFMDRKFENPKERLKLLLQSPESSVLKEEIRLPKKTTICALYTSILQGLPDSHTNDSKRDSHSILHAIVSAGGSVPLSDLAQGLGFLVSPVDNSVRTFARVDNDDRVELPKSLLTFLTDPDLCTDDRFCPPPH